MTKEQIFAAFAANIAAADGELYDSEVQRIAALAEANDLDRNAVLRACAAEVDHPTNLAALPPLMSEDDKELLLTAASLSKRCNAFTRYAKTSVGALSM